MQFMQNSNCFSRINESSVIQFVY